MKKIAPFVILIMFLSFVLILLSNYNDIDLEIRFVNHLYTDSEEEIRLCVLNEDDKLVLINSKKHNDENLYEYILKTYDHYRNNLPIGYTTPLKGNFEVISLEKINDTLNIELDMLYYESGLNTFLSALIWSYKDYGITKINATIDGNVFNINKDTAINTVIESTNIYGNYKQIIYFQNKDEVMPITYYHDDEKLDFLISKLVNKYININFSVELIDDFLVVSVEDEQEELSKPMINLLLMSLEETGEYSNIVIIVNNQDIYNN